MSSVPAFFELRLGGVEVGLGAFSALSAGEACSRVVEKANVIGRLLRDRELLGLLAARIVRALARLAGAGRLRLTSLRLGRRVRIR
jgi:hypothetical protein